MDCLFCKIIAKEITSYVIYEDADALAILDIQPRAPGHTMILPKVHAATILDLPNEKIGPVFAVVKTIAQRLKNMLPCDGLTIGINHGRVSGQLVDHLHIHLIPRWKNDGGLSIHSVINTAPREPLDVIQKRLTT